MEIIGKEKKGKLSLRFLKKISQSKKLAPKANKEKILERIFNKLAHKK